MFLAAASLACVAGACVPATGPPAALPVRPILYQSQTPGGTEDLLLLVPRAGATGTPTLLLRGDSVSSRGLAAWSPDGRRVAYVREYGSRDELYVLDVPTRVERRVGENLPAAVLFPDWSPDGGKLAVSAGPVASHVGISLVDVRTGRAREVRRNEASYRCPSWAPQGDRLVVAAYAAARSALLVLDTAGTVLDTLMQSDTTYLDCPQWSPRGDEILFTIFHGSGLSGWERPAFHSNLAVLSLHRRTIRQLTHGSGLTNYGRWSRDGGWIVFQSDRAAPPTRDAARAARMLQNLDIWIVRRDGTGLQRMTSNNHFDAHPSW